MRETIRSRGSIAVGLHALEAHSPHGCASAAALDSHFGQPGTRSGRARLAELLGTEHVQYEFNVDEALGVVDQVVYHMETYEAELLRSAIPNWFLAKATADGVLISDPYELETNWDSASFVLPKAGSANDDGGW